MNHLSSIKQKSINPRNILGGIPGMFDEIGFESEAFVSSVKGTAGGFFEAIVDLGKDVAGTESKNEAGGKEKFDMNGSIDFNKQEKQKKEQANIERKTLFFQTLKQDQEKAQREQEQAMEQEIAEFVASIPVEQRNELLGLQTEYRNSNSIYHRAELRRKIIEQKNKTKQQEKEASIPNPAKKATALEGAFEGGSGTQGGGQANLSNQAVG